MSLAAISPFWVFAPIIVIAVVFWIVSSTYAKRRAEALQKVAIQIGFRFEGNDQSRATHAGTALFNKGSSRRFRNVMNGVAAGFQTSLYDYSYTISTGKSSSTYTQTVCAFVLEVSLPTFEVRPEGFMDRVVDAFVHKDIDFDSHPEFSRRFVLRGKDEEAIRALFSPALLTFLEALPAERKWHIEGGESTLMFYRSGVRVKPDAIRSFLDETSSIAQTFLSSCGRTSEIK